MFKIALVHNRNQLGDNFGVGFGFEAVSVGDKLILQGLIVLDNTVMYYHQRVLVVRVGMGILVVHPSVGCPAGVAYTVQPAHLLRNNLAQVANLALALVCL